MLLKLKMWTLIKVIFTISPLFSVWVKRAWDVKQQYESCVVVGPTQNAHKCDAPKGNFFFVTKRWEAGHSHSVT